VTPSGLRPLVVDDLARLRWAMEPALHPSGEGVAHVVSGPDPDRDRLGYRLVVADAPGSHRVVEDARRPAWSPDGRHLACTVEVDGQWRVAWSTDAGDVAMGPRLAGDVVAVAWSPASDRVVCTVVRPPPDRPDRPYAAGTGRNGPRSELWVVPLEGEATHLAGSESAAAWGPAWSHDGATILHCTDDGIDRDTSLAVVVRVTDAQGRAVRDIWTPGVPVRGPAWSPDDRSVAVLAASRDCSSSASWGLWVVGVTGGEATRLGSSLDRSVGQAVRGDDERGIGPPHLAWAADGSSVVAIVADGGTSRLVRFGPSDAWDVVPTGELGSILEFDLVGDTVAVSWSDPLTPGDVAIVDLPTGDVQPVSDLGADLRAEVALATTRPVQAVADDGVVIEGWLTWPEGVDRPPLVLQVHGGPHYPVGWRFSFDAQRLAAQGVAVLRANPRGSQGYGAAFAEGNLGDWGGRDLDDLVALVDRVLVDGLADPGRVAIIGESYGGFMAAWAAARTDRFSAVVAENAIADLLSSAGGAVGRTFWDDEMGGPPWDVPDRHLERSPIVHVAGITAPVLLIHCEDDTTCPIAHGEAFHSALRSLGRDVTFVRVPGEDHFFNVFGALGRRLDRTRVLDEFLVAHLNPAPTGHRPEVDAT